MKRIGQKQLSLLLCLVLLFTMAIPAGARASDYFNKNYCSRTAGQWNIQAGAHLYAKSERQSDSKELCFQCNLPHIQRNPRKILLHHRALLRQKRQRHRGHLDRLQRGTGITITFPFRAVNDAARKIFLFFSIPMQINRVGTTCRYGGSRRLCYLTIA